MSDLLPSILFVIIGVALLAKGFIARKRAKTTETWPTAPGSVTSSEVRERYRYDSDSHSGRTTYEPVVEYQYTVMGQVFNANRIAFGEKKTSRKNSGEIVARFPAGAQVSVRYNPDKPEESVLETAARGSNGNLIFGAVLILLAVVLFFWLGQ